MPSYIEGDNIEVTINKIPSMIKPILFTTYDAVTKYNINITYEDSTTKEIELVQNDKDRPYKFIYRQNGKLISVIGIPKVYEVKDGCKFVDFPNKVMDADDLLFDVDCSYQYESIRARFYLKDVRDIVDLAKEPIEDPEDPMEVYPITLYPIYLDEHSCQNVIHCVLDDELKVTLTAEVTKNGEPLEPEEYSDFQILSVSSPVIVDQDLVETNKVPLIFTEDSVNTEIKVILKYFIKEINHPVFDEFTIVANLKDPSDDSTGDDNSEETLDKAVSTQTMQYLGDGLETGLGTDLTPGFKYYKFKKEMLDEE